MRSLAVQFLIALFIAGWTFAPIHVYAASLEGPDNLIRLKDLVHIEGVRDNALVGYGLVVGLAGTGDSSRNEPTLQSIANTLTRFGLRVTSDEISSRNIAGVIITATLPAFINPGDKIDINVASIGDARSLLGGTLMLAPLKGPDEQIYALAQGPLSVGGFRYDAFGNVVQKNHPTVGQIPGGAIVEASVSSHVVSQSGNLFLLLDSPDYTTAARAADAINARMPPIEGGTVIRAQAVDAERIAVRLTEDERYHLVGSIETIEGTVIRPDQAARIVVNERTGAVVSGGDVRLGSVTVSYGELKVSISTEYSAASPILVGHGGHGIRSTALPDVDLDVDEVSKPAVTMPEGAKVSDLVTALNKIKISPRDTISILEAIKRAGSLHAELIIQ
jgi:flagellar P-ring protein precursor FlgI